MVRFKMSIYTADLGYWASKITFQLWSIKIKGSHAPVTSHAATLHQTKLQYYLNELKIQHKWTNQLFI